MEGASRIKYELINKKDKDGKEKRILLAKRCSLRNQCIGFQQIAECKRKAIDMSFEYRPSTLEKLFKP